MIGWYACNIGTITQSLGVIINLDPILISSCVLGVSFVLVIAS